MIGQSGYHAAVYQLLDEVLLTGGTCPGTRGSLFAAIDTMRSNRDVMDEVRRAEAISVALHKLEWARQLGDARGCKDAQAELKSLAGQWLNARIAAPKR